MEIFNFDYFVKRGNVLTEMARGAEAFKDPTLNKLYQDMRTLCRREFGETGSSTIDAIVWPYLYRHATPWLTPAQIQFFETGGKSDSAAVKARAYKVITQQINSGQLDIAAYAKSLENMDNFRDRVAEYRAGGKSKKKSIHTGSDINVEDIQDSYDATYDIIQTIEDVMDDPDNQHPLMQQLLDVYDERLQNDIPTKKDDFSNEIAKFVRSKDPKISIPFTKLNNLFNSRRSEMESQKDWRSGAREPEESGVKGRQLGIINDLEDLGSTPEELRALNVELKPILTQMRSKMGGRKSSRTKKGVHSKYHKFLNPIKEPEPTKQPDQPTDPQYSDEVGEGYNMLYAIENAIVYTFNAIRNDEYLDEGGDSIIDPENKQDILKLLKADRAQIKSAIEAGKKMGRKSAQNFINQAKSSTDPIRREAYEKVAEEYVTEVDILTNLGDPDSDWNQELAAAKQEIENAEQTKLSLLPKGIDLDIYATYLNTPDLLAKFQKLNRLNKGLSDKREERKAFNFIGKDAPKSKFGKTEALKKVQKEKYIVLKQIGSAKFSNQRKELEDNLYKILNQEKELIEAGHDKVPLTPEEGGAAARTGDKAAYKKVGVENRINQIEKELDLLSMSEEEAQDKLSTMKKTDPDYSYNLYHLNLSPEKKDAMWEKLSVEINALKAEYQKLGQAEVEEMPDYEEEEAFGYMSEQFKKDSQFSGKPKKVLLENNYKRFQNYHQWLTFNS